MKTKMKNNNHYLAASKAVHTLAQVDRAYSLGLLENPGFREKLIHDLALKLAHQNLKALVLELIDANGRIILASRVDFTSRIPRFHECGGPNGTEVPLIDKGQVASSRLIAPRRYPDESAYSHLFKLNWCEAENLRRAAGSRWKTTHARKTGGRQTGTMHVTKKARHILVITRPFGSRGYAFAACPDMRLSGVFLHETHSDPKCRQLRAGARVSALLVQSLDGIQARDVRPAA